MLLLTRYDLISLPHSPLSAFCLYYMAVFILFIPGSSAKPFDMFFFSLKDWSLELEEVFALDRDGELNKYSRYKNNLHNKMLLWHGKQLFEYALVVAFSIQSLQ